MDISFLPENLKELIKDELSSENIYCIRACGAFNSQPGEGYIVFNNNGAYFFERSFGSQEFKSITLNFSDISSINFKEEQFSASLVVNTSDGSLYIVLSMAEKDNASLFISLFNKISGQESTTEKQSEAVGDTNTKLSSVTGLAAMLMFLAAVNEDICDCECDFIEKICADYEGSFEAAHEYYQNHSIEELMAALELNNQQKLCCYANMTELAMIDGVMDSKEQELIKRFAEYFGINQENCDAIREVLLLKNQLSIFN